MCGGDGDVRLVPAENGFTIESYIPGGPDKPGRHTRKVASTAEEAMKLGLPMLKAAAKKSKRGERISGPEPVQMVAVKVRGKKKGTKKRASYKR